MNNVAQLELTTTNNVVLGRVPINRKQINDPDYLRHKKFELFDQFGDNARPEQPLQVNLILTSKNKEKCEKS